MNLRLVESIAQIVLAMSAEERQHFEQLIDRADSPKPLLNSDDGKSKRLENEAPLSKDAQIAQIAQQMQAFEEKQSASLSPVPDEPWGA